MTRLKDTLFANSRAPGDPEPPPRRRLSLPGLARVAGLLVIDAGPAGCEASLWPQGVKKTAAPGAVEPLWRGRVGEPAPEQALGLLLKLLRGAGHPLPKQVALITASAVLVQVDLPIDPKQPRAPLQMLEVARYEAEPAIATHDAMWTVGEVLAAREALDPSGRALIESALEQAVRNDRGDLLEFDDDALAQTGLDRAALDAAMRTQQELLIHHQELACGWRGEVLRDAQGQRSPHWRIAAMAQPLRTRWLSALGAHGLRLQGLWPCMGLAVLGEPATVGTTLALELWPEQTVALRLVDGQLAALRSEPRNGLALDPMVLLELLAEWQSEPVAEIVLVVPDPRVAADELVLPLQRMSRTPVRVLAGTGSDAALARARAVWGDQALPADKRRALSIGLSDPRPPVWRRSAWRPWLGLAALAVALLLWQGWTWWHILDMRWQTQRLEDEQRQMGAGGQSDAQMSAEAQRLDQEATYLRQELAALLERTDGMGLIAQRRDTVPALIRALGEVIDRRVVLDAVVESADSDQRLGMEVRAWSVDIASLQDYSARVAEAVAPLGLAVAQGDVVGKPGRFRTPGYQIRFWLVPESAELGDEPVPRVGTQVPGQDSLDRGEVLVNPAPTRPVAAETPTTPGGQQ